MTTEGVTRTASTPGFRLSRQARKGVLAVHIACGVGWMGADVLLGVLVLAGRLSDDGNTVAAAYTAIRLVVPPVVPVLATGMLITGVLLGLGTRWGLVQWWWVVVKLTIGIVLTALVFVALVPSALSIPDGLTGTADHIRDLLGRTGQDLMFPPFVSFAALGFALVLSVYKPWSKTRWGRKGSPTDAPSQADASLVGRPR